MERFVALIPEWDVFSLDLRAIVLSALTDCMGYYRPGRRELGVCAWDARLWDEDASPDWVWVYRDVLDRLGVVVRKRGPRRVIEWTESQARAFQLLHVFTHELGHHADRMTTRRRRSCARGELYAARFEGLLANLVWDDFLRAFPL